MKSSIFFGVINTAGNASYLSKSLKAVGFNTKSLTYRQHPFGYECDADSFLLKAPSNRGLMLKLLINKYTLRVIWIFQKLFLLFKILFRYKIIFFISPQSIFRNYIDLPILKLFGKKNIFFFPGCTERDPNELINNIDGGFCSFCTDSPKKKYCFCSQPLKKEGRINKIEQFSDFIIANRDATGFINNKSKIILPYLIAAPSKSVINTEDKFNFMNRNYLIGHFPSNKLLKRTEFVNKAIENLRFFNIDYISSRKGNEEILKILENVHILVDQFSVGPGLLAIEALARGCVVISRLSKWYKEDYPAIPIVSCEPEELTDTLRSLIRNPDRMKELAQRGLEYCRKYHTYEAVGNYYKRVLELK